MTSWLLFAAGGFVCLLNAYLSWLRYPLFRLRGGQPDDYRWVSGFPWIGSLLVVVAWGGEIREQGSLALDVLAWSLVAVDTGGIHWFLLIMVCQGLKGRSRE